MSLAAACGWSLARSTGVALVAAPVAAGLERRLRSLAGPRQAVAWGMLLAPFLFPTLLSGYAYSGTALRLVRVDLWNRFPPDVAASISDWLSSHNSTVDELLLCALLFFKAVPVGTILLKFSPHPAYSAAAWHCLRMSRGRTGFRAIPWQDQWAYLRNGPSRARLVASGLMFLVAFQEFELPSLLNRPAWTVWLFDAQVGGLALSESLRAVMGPLVVQLVVLVPLWWKLRRGTGNPHRDRSDAPTSLVSAFHDAGYLLLAFSLACLIPIFLVGGETARGLVALVHNRSQLERFTRESLAGFGFALVAAWAALKVAGRRPRAPVHGAAIMQRFVAVLAIAGLFGPLVLGLGLVALLQWGWLNPIYRTPFSLILGLTLYLLPRALLISALLRATDRDGARHAATLLAESGDRSRAFAARDLSWKLGGAAQFWTVALLTYWGYLELTIAYLLGPTTIVSVPVLLYNQMHFGKNAVLSAMTFLAVVVPVMLFLAAAALRPFVRRSLWR